MQVTTNIRDPFEFAPTGWLRDYLEVVRYNEYPWSYHLLSGMLALGASIGRRAAIRRSTYTLWPGISIMLLGESGSGKSEALGVAYRITKRVSEQLDSFTCGDDAANTTIRGWMTKWVGIQKEADSSVLEGVEFMDEVSGLLQKRLGTEGASQWIIKALSHGAEFGDNTGMLGTTKIKNFTVCFGFASPLGTLRDAVDLNAFQGGLMHRFLFANEVDLDYTRGEKQLDEDRVEDLARRVLLLRKAPATMLLSDKAEDILMVLKAKARTEYIQIKALGGFWRRYPGILCKIANLFALSEESDRVEKEHILRADKLVKNHLYPPLATLVLQVSMGPKKRELFRAVDDLELHGVDGMGLEEFENLFDSISQRTVSELIRVAKRNRFIYTTLMEDRVYAKEEWRDGEERRRAGHRDEPSPDDEYGLGEHD